MAKKTKKEAMACGWRWPLGRPNLPWRLDGKPPTAMWVRTSQEELISGSSGLLSLGEAGLPGKLSRSLELLCLVGSLALGLAEHAVPLWAPHLGCLTRLVLYPGGYQALLLPAGLVGHLHSRHGSSTW